MICPFGMRIFRFGILPRVMFSKVESPYTWYVMHRGSDNSMLSRLIGHLIDKEQYIYERKRDELHCADAESGYGKQF